MFRQITDPAAVVGNSLSHVKIQANLKVYQNLPFLQTWQQNDTFLQKIDDQLILASGENMDLPELLSLLHMIDFSSLFTDRKTAKLLKLPVLQSGIVMQKENGTGTSPPANNYDPDYKHLYSILKSGGFPLPDYNVFVSDLSFRVRRGRAHVILDRNACAFTLWETETQAVIAAVCVLPQQRRKGYGTVVLQKLLAALPDKRVYLYREEEKNKKFYNQFGFYDTGDFAVLKRKDF